MVGVAFFQDLWRGGFPTYCERMTGEQLIYTREQLPQDWAMTQNNLGIALQEQGIRTGGAQGTELLAQAVDAYRSALEVYTREVFPSYYELVRKNLDKAATFWLASRPILRQDAGWRRIRFSYSY